MCLKTDPVISGLMAAGIGVATAGNGWTDTGNVNAPTIVGNKVAGNAATMATFGLRVAGSFTPAAATTATATATALTFATTAKRANSGRAMAPFA